MQSCRIQTKNLVLSIDPCGIISASTPEEGRIIFTAAASDLCKINLQESSNESARGRKYFVKSTLPDRTAFEGKSIKLIWNHLEDGDRAFNVSLEVIIRAADDTLEITAHLVNREKSIIAREIEIPCLEIPVRRGHSELLFPDGGGRKYDLTKEPGPRILRYMSMSYMLVDNGGEGVYLGLHDKYFTEAKIKTKPVNHDNSLRCSFNLVCWVEPGCEWKSEPAVVALWHGGWKNAVKYYRRWADTWFIPPSRPEWINNVSGWILCIMKQQNGEVIWNWGDMDILCDYAEKQGLNMLGLYGWTEGGHDRDYPVYTPLGRDEEKVKSAIQRAQKRGIKVILYTNGQLIDIQGEYYKETGPSAAAVSERGEPYLQAWQKYHDAPMKAHAIACQGTEKWSDKLLELAEQINNLGADGILYDQIGFGGALDFCCCFNKAHGHKHPAQVNVNGIINSLSRIQEHMADINPDFIIMSEGAKDCIAMHMDIIWGWAGGYSPGKNSFPDLFFTTFPEYRGFAIQRIPAPAQDEKSIQFAIDNDFLFEVEYRYRADRELAEGKKVSLDSYKNDDVIPLPVITGIPFQESATMMKKAVETKTLRWRMGPGRQ